MVAVRGQRFLEWLYNKEDVVKAYMYPHVWYVLIYCTLAHLRPNNPQIVLC